MQKRIGDPRTADIGRIEFYRPLSGSMNTCDSAVGIVKNIFGTTVSIVMLEITKNSNFQLCKKAMISKNLGVNNSLVGLPSKDTKSDCLEKVSIVA